MSGFGTRVGRRGAAGVEDPTADEGTALNAAVQRRSCLQADQVDPLPVDR
jgi:hypothetical protein